MSGLDLNDLLRRAGIAPEDTIVLRHRPKEPQLHRVLGWFALERPDLFNAYQRFQAPALEKSMRGAGHVAAFVGDAPGRATFVGLYEIQGGAACDRAGFEAMPENQELAKYGLRWTDRRDVVWRFDLALLPHYREWAGRLRITWSGGERSWWRRAHTAKSPFLVEAVLPAAELDAPPPDWRSVVLAWRELQALPRRWVYALEQWRGVYFIFDRKSRQGYVGSAGGRENIYGRWAGYAADGHGGNVGLKGRDPSGFVFSILERVSPDMPREALVELEASWKQRLHTQAFGMNEN